jgi:hypothetical protein
MYDRLLAPNRLCGRAVEAARGHIARLIGIDDDRATVQTCIGRCESYNGVQCPESIQPISQGTLGS